MRCWSLLTTTVVMDSTRISFHTIPLTIRCIPHEIPQFLTHCSVTATAIRLCGVVYLYTLTLTHIHFHSALFVLHSSLILLFGQSVGTMYDVRYSFGTMYDYAHIPYSRSQASDSKYGAVRVFKVFLLIIRCTLGRGMGRLSLGTSRCYLVTGTCCAMLGIRCVHHSKLGRQHDNVQCTITHTHIPYPGINSQVSKYGAGQIFKKLDWLYALYSSSMLLDSTRRSSVDT